MSSETRRILRLVVRVILCLLTSEIISEGERRQIVQELTAFYYEPTAESDDDET